MPDEPKAFQWPYTPTPGGSTPPSTTDPREGMADLWGFVGLSLASTFIIAVTGLVVWAVVH